MIFKIPKWLAKTFERFASWENGLICRNIVIKQCRRIYWKPAMARGSKCSGFLLEHFLLAPVNTLDYTPIIGAEVEQNKNTHSWPNVWINTNDWTTTKGKKSPEWELHSLHLGRNEFSGFRKGTLLHSSFINIITQTPSSGHWEFLSRTPPPAWNVPIGLLYLLLQHSDITMYQSITSIGKRSNTLYVIR